MKRRLINFVTALSLLLCVALALLWARSYAAWVEWSVAMAGGPLVRVYSGDGSVHVQWVGTWNGQGGGEWWRRTRASQFGRRRILGSSVVHGADLLDWQPPVAALTRNMGTMFVSGTSSPVPIGVGYVYRRVPYALPLAAAGLPPLLALVRRSRRRQRTGSHCCPSCGYNLTGNVSGVCPECGAACASQGAGGGRS